MVFDFLQGILLGFTVAVPVGPINLLIMNEAIKSYKNSCLIGFGAMSADVTYLIFIIFGLSVYLKNTDFLNWLTFGGALFLFFIAYSIFKQRNEPIRKIHVDVKRSWIKYYIKGYALTLVSPYTVLFWLSIATLSIRTEHPGFIIGGMLFAILLWITLMPYFIFKTKHLISQKIYSKIALVSAFVFSVFAFGMIIRLFLGFFN